MMSEECHIICGEHSTNVSECRDVKSWRTLYEADEIRQQRVLAKEVTENGLPSEIVKYAGRDTFTHKKQLHRIANDPEKPVEDNPRRRSGRYSNGSSSVILPSHSIFCEKR